jgi:signal transduction histidine kinase
LALLAAARAVPTVLPGAALAARAHQDAFLAGMDRIVDEYEREARGRVVELRRVELALLVLVLAVLALEGAFVFRPAVRGLSAHLAALDLAQRAMLQISDREQIRLAQDLHDGLGQHLVGIAFLLRSLRREVGAGGPADRVDEIDKLLAEAIDHARGLARGLHPHTLEAAGLAAALGELAVHTERVFGVACRVTSHAAGAEPPAPDRAHLHRIAREAVLNAAKHAGARTIDIELVRDGSRLTLVVRDDGVGIGARSPDGMGLHLMEYRAKMMGGSLQITAGERRGTTVTCSIMLRDRPAPKATA